jgi:hypothetical protein
MSVRTNLGTCLIFATIFAAANSANGQDQALARASSAMDGCVRYVAQQAMVVRCALGDPRILSDHGMTAGEAYDVQGNPVDRHGNIVAVPESGRTQHREVFASERQTLR